MGMSRLVGDPIDAVLPPPQLRRFRALTGVDDDALDVAVRGWHKLVVLTADRAFLFARHAGHVAGLERELVAYRTLGAGGVPLVPRLLDVWHDPEVHPHPFAAVTRLPGTHLDDPVGLFPQLGVAIAAWHELRPLPDELAPTMRPPGHDAPHLDWFHRALDPTATADAVAEAVDRLGASDRRARWTEQLGAAATLAHVLVHGDIHEDQLLAGGGDELTGVLDWESARLDHPFFDFDFGEWGTGLWRRHERDFAELWRRQWEPYARARGLDLPVEPLVTAFGIRQLLVAAAREPSTS